MKFQLFNFSVDFRYTLYYYYYYCYCYSALGPLWAETRVQSGDWYGSGTMHLGQVFRGSLPLISPDTLYIFNTCSSNNIGMQFVKEEIGTYLYSVSSLFSVVICYPLFSRLEDNCDQENYLGSERTRGYQTGILCYSRV